LQCGGLVQHHMSAIKMPSKLFHAKNVNSTTPKLKRRFQPER
jgi:hypothetical protein